MKLKRFSAPDIRRAITLVREELGPNAVILSNRPTEDGVEIIAAIDYDESQLDKWEEKAVDLPIENSTPRTNRTLNPGTLPSKAELANTVNSLADRFSSGARKSGTASVAAGKGDHRSTVDWLNRLKENQGSQQEENYYDDRSAVDREESFEDQYLDDQPSFTADVPPTNSLQDRQMLNDMWGEIQNLRGLLERQLSSIAWGDISKRFPQKALATRKLLELGLSPVTVRRMLHECKDVSEFEQIWRKALGVFSSKLPTTKEDLVMKGGVIAVVGPTGVGKTTTLAKMAARYALRYGTEQIALITTDNYRVGAQEQLKTYGRIMDVPVRVVNNAHELRRTLKSFVNKKLVLIDTAGMSQRDLRLMEQFTMLSEGSTLIQTLLVVSAATQMEVLDETMKAYQKAVLDGCIITKIDETHSLGGILSVVAHYQLPIAYISDGQRVPEDLHMENSVGLIKKSIALMQKHPRKIEDEAVELVFGGAADYDIQ